MKLHVFARPETLSSLPAPDYQMECSGGGREEKKIGAEEMLPDIWGS